MIWSTVSSWSCLYWLYRTSSFLAAKNIINLISVLVIWWCPCVVFSCVAGRGCLLWPMHFLGKTLLVFALFHSIFQLCFLPAIYLGPKTTLSFLGMLVLKGLVGLHRTIQLQLLQRYCLGHRLGLPWCWMVCLGNEQRSLYHSWDCIQALHFRLFCWPWWLLHFFWEIPDLSSRYNGHLS